MIWEVDDDIDGYVSEEEFIKMYKRCWQDKANLEPRKLYNLVLFLMFDFSKKEPKGKIIIEDTL